MAESMIIPPWLTREYDPATTFLNAFKTGAAISQAQQQLAQSQRQSEVAAQLKREEMQNDLLRTQAQAQATEAYQRMQIGLRQASLEAQKQQAKAAAEEALMRLQEQHQHNIAMEGIDRRRVAAMEARNTRSNMPVPFQGIPGSFVTSNGAVIQPKANPADVETITTKLPATEAVPEKKGFGGILGLFKSEPSPAVPAMPEQTIRRVVPISKGNEVQMVANRTDPSTGKATPWVAIYDKETRKFLRWQAPLTNYPAAIGGEDEEETDDGE